MAAPPPHTNRTRHKEYRELQPTALPARARGLVNSMIRDVSCAWPTSDSWLPKHTKLMGT